MNATEARPLPDLLLQYLALSDQGVLVLDADDRFRYVNAAAATLFELDETALLGQVQGHEVLMRRIYAQHAVAKTAWPTVESWLAHTHGRYRSTPTRSFELDLQDGRSLLVTEQLCPGGELVMHCSDVTRQKDAEQALRQVQADLERLALSDELSGLPNRRNFLQQLRQEFAKSVRHLRPLCLAVLDIDYLKKVNDHYGHVAGDEVLRHFAQLMREQLRTGDVLGRLGGGEFGVLLPETGIDDALLVLNRMAEALAGQRLEQIAPDFGYAFSGGLVERLDHAGLDCGGLMVLADQALYEAKAAGRGRITSYRWN
ncbi:diguanylate cyclase [Chitinimonas sp.]|uniref:GGDEF domain-containing protein n=1 Tax=Chitinimonas sp. TaxID=1934313 RepID=UPI002F930FFE